VGGRAGSTNLGGSKMSRTQAMSILIKNHGIAAPTARQIATYILLGRV